MRSNLSPSDRLHYEQLINEDAEEEVFDLNVLFEDDQSESDTSDDNDFNPLD